jgi:hypothetical protein
MSSGLPRTDFEEVEIEKFIHSSEGYLPQYKALVQLGASVKNADESMALALAVYGWMPTILRSLKISDQQLTLIQTAGDINAGIAAIQAFSVPPVNNSWVGSSKFLHFLNPNVFPIWDSHIARAFGWLRRGQYETSAKYIMYMAAIRDLLPLSENSRSEVISRIERQFGYKISPVRALEFLIFSDSRTKHAVRNH